MTKGSVDQASTSVPRAGGSVAAGGLRNRANTAKANSAKTATKSGPAPRAPAQSSNPWFAIRAYDEDTPGLKVGPTSVLITSLVYIASVVLLHIWGKFRSPVD
mmetsp:Transcript_27613/g.108230  ORF Transcript_27613/g.108230 Transcript_27613/m.108230 type:complete len:103 (+) Transcript_27613:164-472(+)